MRNTHNRIRKLASCETPRKGNILLLSTGVLIGILAFAAFTVDVGYIALTKTQLQTAVDGAALAGAMELNPVMEQDDVVAAVKAAAVELAALNRAGDHSEVFLDPNTDIELGRRDWNSGSQSYDYEFGPTATPYNLVRVTARRTQIMGQDDNGNPVVTDDRRLPLFFAPVIGHKSAGLETVALATFQPRDVMLVLDYSASMNDDSEFKSIGTLPQSEVEANIYQMWQDLGSPTYGNMGYTPEYPTKSGQPASGPVPHIDVTWKGKEVYVVSTKDLSNVVLEYTNGSTQKFEGLSGRTGTFKGTGNYYGRYIERVWVKSGSNSSGEGPGYGERFDFDVDGIKEALGLDDVAYPGESGNWDNFINYVRSYSHGMPYYDRDVEDAGYRCKYGVLCLIQFWNLHKPMHNQTSFLWKMSQQPITALKNSTDLFLDYLTDVEAEDNVGLSVYTYSNSDALLEHGLTTDFEAIKTTTRQRQAGHYDQMTNIGAGMRNARLELVDNARPNAFRMMVLMTDGIANVSSTGASPENFALQEAYKAAENKIKIVTISLGTGADTDLMQQIADITGGIHFNVPGGAGVAEYEQQLKDVFAEIAADRPLKLLNNDSVP